MNAESYYVSEITLDNRNKNYFDEKTKIRIHTKTETSNLFCEKQPGLLHFTLYLWCYRSNDVMITMQTAVELVQYFNLLTYVTHRSENCQIGERWQMSKLQNRIWTLEETDKIYQYMLYNVRQFYMLRNISPYHFLQLFHNIPFAVPACILESLNFVSDKYCDALGDYTVFGFNRFLNNSEVLPNNSVILAAARVSFAKW